MATKRPLPKGFTDTDELPHKKSTEEELDAEWERFQQDLAQSATIEVEPTTIISEEEHPAESEGLGLGLELESTNSANGQNSVSISEIEKIEHNERLLDDYEVQKKLNDKLQIFKEKMQQRKKEKSPENTPSLSKPDKQNKVTTVKRFIYNSDSDSDSDTGSDSGTEEIWKKSINT